MELFYVMLGFGLRIVLPAVLLFAISAYLRAWDQRRGLNDETSLSPQATETSRRAGGELIGLPTANLPACGRSPGGAL